MEIEVNPAIHSGVFGNLVISNYPNLEKVIMKPGGGCLLNSIKISDNDKLKDIVFGKFSLGSVKNVLIDSIILVTFLM